MADGVVAIVSSGSEDDESQLPSREECESRCQMFAEVTGTDSALAMFYLQDRDWNVERAIADYFAEQDSGSSDSPLPKQPNAVHSSTSCKRTKVADLMEDHDASKKAKTETKKTSCVTLGAPVLQHEQTGTVRILSWNIDGLDPDNLQSRTEGACAVILQENPEVLFLQEVVHRSLAIIKVKLEMKYKVVTGDLDPVGAPGAYFTAMLLRKDVVSTERARVLDFPGSVMSRDLMEVQCQVKAVPMVLLTSHLESTKEHSDERKAQLKMAFDAMVNADSDRTVVFGGDLNLRDKEVAGSSAMPKNVIDIWEATGKRKEAKFTWDLMINDNKQLGTNFQPRCRFDRLFIRPCAGRTVSEKTNDISKFFSGKKTSGSIKTTTTPESGGSSGDLSVKSSTVGLKPVYFELVGIQRLASCRRFPSDHWGILAHLQIV